MTSTTGPTTGHPISSYDLLDVDPDASTTEIRAAWKAAVADLDPTDRRFRAYNRAAEVLLDEEQRAAYDAELAALAEPEAPAEARAGSGDASDSADSSGPVAEAADRPRFSVLPGWLLAALAVVTALAVAGAISLWWFKPSDAAVADATAEARAAAERAVPAIFSYDFERLDSDRDAAMSHLTAAKAADYEKLFEGVIRDNATANKVKVEAVFRSSGVVRTGAGREADDRIQVFVMFDQVRALASQPDPVTMPAFATLTMERVGDTWLVADFQGPPVAD